MTDFPLDAVKPGLYRHFKGTRYRVLGVFEHTETHDHLVVYTVNDGPYMGARWVRPLEHFLSPAPVEPGSSELVPRFVEIVEHTVEQAIELKLPVLDERMCGCDACVAFRAYAEGLPRDIGETIRYLRMVAGDGNDKFAIGVRTLAKVVEVQQRRLIDESGKRQVAAAERDIAVDQHRGLLQRVEPLMKVAAAARAVHAVVGEGYPEITKDLAQALAQLDGGVA